MRHVTVTPDVMWSNKETMIADYWITYDMLNKARQPYGAVRMQAGLLERLVRNEIEAVLKKRYKTPDLSFDLILTGLSRVNWLEIIVRHQ